MMKCMVCGKEIVPGNKFCIYCGVAVPQAESTPPAAEDEESNLVILNDEDGNEVPFEFLDLIPYRGNEYVVLLPTDEDAQEVVILQLKDAGEEESYLAVDDQRVLDAVFTLFKERNQDSFNFN